jgi:hypothetical protein
VFRSSAAHQTCRTICTTRVLARGPGVACDRLHAIPDRPHARVKGVLEEGERLPPSAHPQCAEHGAAERSCKQRNSRAESSTRTSHNRPEVHGDVSVVQQEAAEHDQRHHEDGTHGLMGAELHATQHPMKNRTTITRTKARSTRMTSNESTRNTPWRHSRMGQQRR